MRVTSAGLDLLYDLKALTFIKKALQLPPVIPYSCPALIYRYGNSERDRLW